MKKFFLTLLLILLNFSIFAGDVSVFKNLGFSEDSKYFLFAEYGYKEDGVIYANFFCVDVKRNSFVKQGVFTYTFRKAVKTGQSSEGAVLNGLREMPSTVISKKINHVLTGRMVYFRDPEDNSPAVKFRDFSDSKEYEFELVPSVETVDSKVVSSFYINLSITDADGKINQYRVGNPAFKRKGVNGYTVKQIVKSPDNKSLIFIIEKSVKNENGTSVRYMVETVKLK